MTNIGAGIGGQVGFKDTSASNYGVYGAPTKFFEVNKATVTKTKKSVLSSGIAAGRLVDYSSRRAITSTGATVSLDLDVPFSGGFGGLLKMLFGTTAAPVQQASSTAYLQTHTPLDTKGIQSTIQVGIPTTDGTVNAYNYNGVKATKGSFSCGVDGMLSSTFDMDAQAVEETDTLAAATYPVANVFHFGEAAVSWGTFGSEAAIDGVKSISVNVERKMNTSRYYQGNNSTGAVVKDEPLTNDTMAITGTIETDFINKTYFADKFATVAAGLDTPQSLVWTFTGPLIASTYHYQFKITLPSVYIDSPSPSLDGKDVVSTQFSFTALYDGTNPAITVAIISTDTTLS